MLLLKAGCSEEHNYEKIVNIFGIVLYPNYNKALLNKHNIAAFALFCIQNKDWLVIY